MSVDEPNSHLHICCTASPLHWRGHDSFPQLPCQFLYPFSFCWRHRHQPSLCCIDCIVFAGKSLNSCSCINWKSRNTNTIINRIVRINQIATILLPKEEKSSIFSLLRIAANPIIRVFSSSISHFSIIHIQSSGGHCWWHYIFVTTLHLFVSNSNFNLKTAFCCEIYNNNLFFTKTLK